MSSSALTGWWLKHLVWIDAPLTTRACARLAIPLSLLLRFYQQADRTVDIHTLWIRFRRLYPVCYTPLLADRHAAGDWPAGLIYAQEALEIATQPRPTYSMRRSWDSPDKPSLAEPTGLTSALSSLPGVPQ
jgi:hypothetical protein